MPSRGIVTRRRGRPVNGTITLNYHPRWYQRLLHDNATRFNVWICHRRAGKTVAVIMECIKELILLGQLRRDRPRAGYVAPLYRQAKRVAWDYVKAFTRPIPGMQYRESELRAVFPWGAEFALYGADNPDSLRGEYFDIVALDEVAQMSPRVWSEVLRPALADREGRAIFIGTPMGKRNLLYRLYEHAGAEDAESWSRAYLTVDETGILSDAELNALRLEMTDEEYRQEMLCDWSASVQGAYFGKLLHEMERDGRIGEYEFDRSLPVLTSWDFGIADPTIIGYWQMHGDQPWLIACDAISDLSLPEVLAQVKATRPYSWGRHFAPHDATKRGDTEWGAPSRTDVAAEHGFSFEVVARTAIDEGIDAVRRMLPRVRINRKLVDVIEALQLYRAAYDDKAGVYRLKPVHDWTSHYADMVRVFAQGTDGRGTRRDAQLDLLDAELDRWAI